MNVTGGYHYYNFQQTGENTLLNHGPRIGLGASFYLTSSSFSRIEYNAVFYQEDYCLKYVNGLDYAGESRRYRNNVMQNQLLYIVTGGLNWINFKLGVDWDVVMNRHFLGVQEGIDDDECIFTAEEDQFNYHTFNFHMGMYVNFKQKWSFGVDAIVGFTDWYVAGTPSFDPDYYDFAGQGVRRSMWAISLSYWLFKKPDE